MHKNLEDRVPRGLLDAYASQTAQFPTSAAGASLPVTPSAPALNVRPVAVPGMQATATEARSEDPLLSTPIDVDRLHLELSDHPGRDFVDSLIHILRFGAHIGYTGPRRPCISRNLISASQHSDIVSDNLSKEVKLGRVAGPFLSPPLPDLQCHPVGIVPKKHSSERRTIYHLSYPKGESINDHIPKDLYSFQYVRVDDAIHILQTLGPGSFMAKTD